MRSICIGQGYAHLKLRCRTVLRVRPAVPSSEPILQCGVRRNRLAGSLAPPKRAGEASRASHTCSHPKSAGCRFTLEPRTIPLPNCKCNKRGTQNGTPATCHSAPRPKNALPSHLPCDAGRAGNDERLPHHAASPAALSVEASAPDVFWRLAKDSWSPSSSLVGSLAALAMLRPRLLMAMGLSVITHNALGHDTIFSVLDIYYAFPCFCCCYMWHLLSTLYVSDILGIYKLLAIGD